MTDADALSRQFEGEVEDKTVREISKQVLGKIEKHRRVIDGIEHWEFDTGRRAEIPKMEDREKLITEVHRNLNHRGVKGTYYQIKQKYYWPGMKDHITQKLKALVEISAPNFF
ncbi:Pro-Pol polyprotein [Nosema granulosis]|uniref:Pro-Pol polyprotein n=1 Tax=Nosema granulosis TaxID=83296 RepID=A0A9P6GX49_9MICR|nr:Pro-Pol polyprotein [Nosema granulosis]